MSENFRKVSTELWDHATCFLDKYNRSNGQLALSEFYSLDNALLKAHKQAMEQDFSEDKAQIRDLYLELIKLIYDEEYRLHPDSHMEVRDIHKLQGFQDLTNRLQRATNAALLRDVHSLKREVEQLRVNQDQDNDLRRRVRKLEKKSREQADAIEALTKQVEILKTALNNQNQN